MNGLGRNMNNKKDVPTRHGDTTAPGRHRATADGEQLSHESFAHQFRDSFRALWLVAVSILKNHAIAEDAVQEAAVIALGKIDQFEPGTNFQAWMGRIVRNVALNMARKESKRRASSGDADLLKAQPTSDELGNVTNSEINSSILTDARLKSALESVGDVARACLLLRIVQELNYIEISSLLDIPEGTAMSHVHRARAHLRARLAETSEAITPDTSKDVPPK